ncbi:Uncharacterized protein ALO47_04765 [Pseudomonas syringae pv. ribicola]|uniref:Uncharacterized protein n=1 Tax=Pseudomonas syringae pv. ribicola TaxID=55398 RepID=A0A0N8SNP3_PSESI|nr:Uncharacterized protein ALO47_04765 [Pseudomonas syringae pv. ribicola]
MSMHDPRICDKNPAPATKCVGNVLRAGRNSPPAVMTRNASSPRALEGRQQRLMTRKVSRPGVIPGPTVIVRMKREREWRLKERLQNLILNDNAQAVFLRD